VDFVVLLRGSDVNVLAEAFPSVDFYLPPPETITTEMQREQRGHFNIIHIETGFKADMYLTGRDELNAWALTMRRQAQLDHTNVRLRARSILSLASRDRPHIFLPVGRLDFYKLAMK